MKNYKITKLIIALCLFSVIASCDTDNDDQFTKTAVTDFTKEELIKLHGGSEKSWKLTEVILPEKYKDHPNLLNNTCVADDTFTVSASTSTTYESVEDIIIELGEIRCFDTFSEAERFEGKLLYVPYKFNGIDVVETTLILKSCSIENIVDENGTEGTFTKCDQDAFRLVELTDDRMVFSNAAYIGEYTFGYVFEKADE
ncbi:hypothetical protein SAMN06265371_102226 [Lutibacter agarilyticus]|uniref:Lipocalin-like domain-containing protein n=1 Tax=Lutibacter agarilyticus TaxID=1109740 RepID=A0A238VXS6_9FLAO|nr:hypothetical protein [Lutibacter agarilyticus]SNR39096.1 hypothetical protein SAMN06265371_102226 [Lutibacter agarilyticus]